MKKVAFIFPGQGSQVVGMGKDLYGEEPVARRIFDEADERLGFSLSRLIFEGPEEELRLTYNTQPALYTVSSAFLAVIENRTPFIPDYVAGHSLGEYTAYHAAGAIPFGTGVELVRKRGEWMEEAYPAGRGAMAAILGMEREPLRLLCEEVTREGMRVELANLNSPGQIVLSGTREGVDEAGKRARERGAKRVIPLQVSGPFHSSLMSPAREKMEQKLRETEGLKDPVIPVISNVSAKEVTSREEMIQALIQQVTSPVLWEDSIRRLIQLGVNTFVEVGAGSVLTGLVKKIDKGAETRNVSNLEQLCAWVKEWEGEMKNA
ncbi:malonyl CoA:acyl carrier protein transacylase [[Clostridium] ultunense Esp]|nr:malonyl CoA:acyl carrier protein transacylase [[Clostridium] ultunense Esp]